MKKIYLSLFLVLIALSTACKDDTVAFESPIEQHRVVDGILNSLATKPQLLSAPTNDVTSVIGAQGTVITVDPDLLETLDGTPLGTTIDIELKELVNASDFILNNAPTMANGRQLISGGAYYLNMTTDGKSLKIKDNQSIAVQFPKRTEEPMKLFLGQPDSLGQINWSVTAQNFKIKDSFQGTLPPPPISSEAPTTATFRNISDSISWTGSQKLETYLDRPEEVLEGSVSEAEFKKYQEKLLAYQLRKKEYDFDKKTYSAIQLSNFGWINCDTFTVSMEDRTTVVLRIPEDSIRSARFFAIFKDINSVMSTSFHQSEKVVVPSFADIPKNMDLHIIGIATQGEFPYVFETKINSGNIQEIAVEFKPISQKQLKDFFDTLNQ